MRPGRSPEIPTGRPRQPMLPDRHPETTIPPGQRRAATPKPGQLRPQPALRADRQIRPSQQDPTPRSPGRKRGPLLSRKPGLLNLRTVRRRSPSRDQCKTLSNNRRPNRGLRPLNKGPRLSPDHKVTDPGRLSDNSARGGHEFGRATFWAHFENRVTSVVRGMNSSKDLSALIVEIIVFPVLGACGRDLHGDPFIS